MTLTLTLTLNSFSILNTQMIITLCGVQVIVDRDLAMLYGVEIKRMNEQVRRNLNEFPSRFLFQLTKEEVNDVVAN